MLLVHIYLVMIIAIAINRRTLVFLMLGFLLIILVLFLVLLPALDQAVDPRAYLGRFVREYYEQQSTRPVQNTQHEDNTTPHNKHEPAPTINTTFLDHTAHHDEAARNQAESPIELTPLNSLTPSANPYPRAVINIRRKPVSATAALNYEPVSLEDNGRVYSPRRQNIEAGLGFERWYQYDNEHPDAERRGSTSREPLIGMERR